MMSSINKAPVSISSMFARIDNAPMRERDREMAKAYLCKTEAMLDLIWFVAARTRAAITGAWGVRPKAGAGISSQKRRAAHLQ